MADQDTRTDERAEVRSNAPRLNDSRLRAYGQFLAALSFYFLARMLARHGAAGLVSETWAPLVEQTMLVFLLLLGFAGVGFSLNRQTDPISEQGLPRRRGWPGEIGLGVALGWGAALVGVIAVVLGGGIAVRFDFSARAWTMLGMNLALFAVMTLAEEIAFRGYAFQRFERSLGSAAAAVAFAALYAFLMALQTGASHASVASSFLLGLVLSTAYLRSRALWVSWGLNFGWKASRAVLFGLAVAGDTSHASVVQGDPMGSFWLTGGGYGLDGSWMMFVILLVLLPVVYRVTRELDYHHNAPVFVAGGIPVDLDGAARRQHEAAMGPAEPAAPQLVQIAPLTPSPAPPIREESGPESGNETP